MKLSIVNLGLPEFFDRKSDIIYGLFHAFNDLGFNTTIEHNQFNAKSLNIVIGSDIIAGDANAVRQLTQSGVDYVIYEVENYNGTTINYRDNFNLDNYKTVLRHAKSIITPYKYNIKALEATCNGSTPVHYAKWGFHESMIRQNIDRNGSFSHSALFFGLIKGSRVEKLNALKDRYGKSVQFIDQTLPFTIRDYFMSDCKFGLSLSYGKTDDFVNPFRIMSMIANGMPVLADHEIDGDDYLNLCESYDFSELLNEIESRKICSTELKEKCRSLDLTDNLWESYDFKNRTAVLYLYCDKHVRSQTNFENFASNGLVDNVDFFVAGSEDKLSRTNYGRSKFKKLYFNDGEHDHQKFSRFYHDQIKKSDYQNVVIVSSRMCGPHPSPDDVHNWVQRFTTQLTTDIHLVGSTIVVMPNDHPLTKLQNDIKNKKCVAPYVPASAFAISREGLDFLNKKSFFEQDIPDCELSLKLFF